jgi:hypothetical protein
MSKSIEQLKQDYLDAARFAEGAEAAGYAMVKAAEASADAIIDAARAAQTKAADLWRDALKNEEPT